MAINSNTNSTNQGPTSTSRPRSARPRSSAAQSVTSGTTSLGPLGLVQQSSGGSRNQQHKLKSRFSVIRKLGKGTYGKVQLAINKETGQEVAIKTIKKSKIENEQDLERVRREIQIMSSIEHPHIVHIYEVFENKDKIVLVMQYAPGGELYEYVSQSKLLDDNEARRLFRQIATAIYYCHSNKICHRDLKLENILLDEKNNAKLADFGLSNVFDKRRQLSTFCGSPLYASPEIVQGSPYEGPEVDCWSLGVLLYTLVYGAMPFDGRNFKLLVKQISEANYFEPKQRSQASPLIRHLLCADPRRRANIMDICQDPWVNGFIPATPPISAQDKILILGQDQDATLEPSSEQADEAANKPQTRHSLLLVAQDMVKLAPVRLDLLMALLPPELSSVINQENVAPRMEKEEVPLASYVVRDLEPTEEQDEASQKDAKSKMDIGEQAELDVQLKQAEIDKIMQENDNATEAANVVCTDNTEEGDQLVELKNDEIAHEERDEPMEVEQLATCVVPLPESNPIVETLELKTIDSEADPNEVSVKTITEDSEQFPIADETQDAIIAEIKNSQEGDKLEVPSPGDQANSMEGSKSPMSVDSLSGDKTKATPTKKKKKIIVVKKVVKKAKAPKPADDLTSVESAEKVASQEPETEKSATETSKPPDNATKEEMSDVQDQQQRLQKQLRRRSTLVAEMSDKLLQQLAADASASGASSPNAAQLKMEQAALFGQVNVIEKKEDFERRASLMLPMEMELDHCKRPSFDRQNTESECANLTEQIAIEKQQACQLLIVGSENRSDSLETLKAADQELDLDKNHNQSPTCVSCEWTQQEDPIRSSLEIDLSSPKQESASERVHEANTTDEPQNFQTPPTQLQTPGPVPITRSYKKVTFTKDGACITETGKVYSAKADDGTLRRIERKSKVTHYPADQAQFGSSSASGNSRKVVTEETTEEQFFSSSGQDSAIEGRWPSGFERLVMPSSSLLLRDNSDHHFESAFNNYRNEPTKKTTNLSHSASNASSNSSNSTDIFDDIFDNWTGAISMFERQRLNERLLRDHKFHQIPNSLLDRHFRRKMSSNGSRCESADVTRDQLGSGSSNIHAKLEQFSARPASAIGTQATRLRHSGAFGGSRPNLFFNKQENLLFQEPEDLFNQDDPFEELFEPGSETGDLMRQISEKHSQLRKQFSGIRSSNDGTMDSRRRLGRNVHGGSMQSLISDHHFQPTHQNPTSQAASPMPNAPAKPPLPQRAKNNTQTMFDSQQQQQMRTINSDLDGSVASPLDAKPIRLRNMASVENLIKRESVGSDQAADAKFKSTSVMQRSSSRSSLISDQLSRLQMSESQSSTQKSNKQLVASFIELKRTSSSSLGPTTTTRSIIINPDGTKQVIETTRTTSHREDSLGAGPSRVSSQMGFQDQLTFPKSPLINQQQQNQAHATTADMRIQSWLQESSSNFSSSSGSKSSTSFATLDNNNQRQLQSKEQRQIPLRSNDSFANLYRQQAEQVTSSTSNHLKQASSSSIADTIANATSSTAIPMDKKHVVSTSSTSRQMFNFQDDPPSSKATATTKTTKVTSTTSTTMQLQHNQQPIVSATKTCTQSSLMDELFGANEVDHQSQSTNSSRSILDQLRTCGLRSVLNQRMASTATSLVGATTTDSGLLMTEQAASSPISSQSSSAYHELTASISPVKQQTQNIEDHPSDQTSANEMGLLIQNGLMPPPDQVVGENAQKQTLNEEKRSKQRIADDNESTTDDKSDGDGKNVDEDDDECLKTARANIKTYRDRMKETDLFLKNLAVADEEAQRQRQQLFMFNDLLIRNKLNGLTSKLSGDFNCKSDDCFADKYAPKSSLGFMSAPIKASSIMTSSFSQQITPTLDQQCSNYTDTMQQRKTNDFFAGTRRRPSLSGYRTNTDHYYLPPKGSNDIDLTLSSNGYQKFTRAQSLAPEVLEKRPAIAVTPVRSTFQTFAPDWTPPSQISNKSGSKTSQRPLSINLTSDRTGDSSELGPKYRSGRSNNYSRRASSVARQMTQEEVSHKQPTSASVYMTEYQRAYGNGTKLTTSNNLNGFFANPTRTGQDEVKCNNVTQTTSEGRIRIEDGKSVEDEDELIEMSMSAYRPSSYVPKVVPQGMPKERHSRSYQRRSFTSAQLQRKTSPFAINNTNGPDERGLSISDRYSKVHSPSPARNRRASYYGISELESNTSPMRKTLPSSRRYSTGNSSAVDTEGADDYKTNRQDESSTTKTGRLSELESRMEANKRRREELLAASKREFATFAGKTLFNTPGTKQTLDQFKTLDQIDSHHVKTRTLDDRPRSRSVARDSDLNASANKSDFNELESPKAPPTRLVPRSSRLESMEARIKRRSYYVRVADSNSIGEQASLTRQIDVSASDRTRQDSLSRLQLRRASTSTAECE